MELHHHHAILIPFAHHGVCQALGGIGLSNAGCALQDDVLLAPEQVDERVIFFILHVHFGKEIICCIYWIDDNRLIHFLLRIILFEKSIQLSNIVSIRRVIRQHLGNRRTIRMLPAAFMCLFDLTEILVQAIPGVIIIIIRFNDAATDNFMLTSLGKDHIARFHVMHKLPGFQGRMLIRAAFFSF